MKSIAGRGRRFRRTAQFFASRRARRSPRPAAPANQCGLRRAIQSSAHPRARRSSGMSSASRMSPSGSIPEAQKRQDAQAPADDEEHAGGNTRPAPGGPAQPAGDRLDLAPQAADQPLQPPLMLDMGNGIGRTHLPRKAFDRPATPPQYRPRRTTGERDAKTIVDSRQLTVTL